MIYFVADVHLGLSLGDATQREQRFASWLKSINRPDTEALYLLGDIWDFWYEYKRLIPREGVRVLSAIVSLLESGIKVYYFPGNHDVWLYSFWQDLGVQVVEQPLCTSTNGARFLLGHGDGLGGAPFGYRCMRGVFQSRFCQALFNTLHPSLAFSLGYSWSNRNRHTHKGYRFRGADEPLYKYCVEQSSHKAIDFCIFGHFHDSVDMLLPTGARLVVLKDWIDGGVHYATWSGTELSVY